MHDPDHEHCEIESGKAANQGRPRAGIRRCDAKDRASGTLLSPCMAPGAPKAAERAPHPSDEGLHRVPHTNRRKPSLLALSATCMCDAQRVAAEAAEHRFVLEHSGPTKRVGSSDPCGYSRVGDVLVYPDAARSVGERVAAHRSNRTAEPEFPLVARVSVFLRDTPSTGLQAAISQQQGSGALSDSVYGECARRSVRSVPSCTTATTRAAALPVS